MERSDGVPRLTPHSGGWRWIPKTPESDWDGTDEGEAWSG